MKLYYVWDAKVQTSDYDPNSLRDVSVVATDMKNALERVNAVYWNKYRHKPAAVTFMERDNKVVYV